MSFIMLSKARSACPPHDRSKILRWISSSLVALLLCSCSSTQIQDALNTGLEISQALGQGELSYADGVKQTLSIGSRRAAESLNTPGAYMKSALYRIALPDELNAIGSTLKRFGLGSQVEALEASMNRAAELAAGEAVDVFVQAAQSMSIEDALGILRGNETAATDYFKAKTGQTLKDRYQPIIEKELQALSFYEDLDQFRQAYNLIPLGNKPSLDLESHVINEGLSSLFSELSKQESLIREDPLKRGSEALASVFARARDR